ncbi:MAG: hypothetical protein U0Y82_08010 [Thermoleophilia bacterium]
MQVALYLDHHDAHPRLGGRVDGAPSPARAQVVIVQRREVIVVACITRAARTAISCTHSGTPLGAGFLHEWWAPRRSSTGTSGGSPAAGTPGAVSAVMTAATTIVDRIRL